VGARSFLLHGLLAGLIAGFIAFGVASVVGEPTVEAAISLEGTLEESAPATDDHSHDEGTAAHSHEEEAAEISRDTQSGIGLLVGMLAAGLVLGGLTGLAAATALGRMGSLAPTASTALVVAIGALSFSIVPFLKYPATPPAAGDPTTIDERTASYFAFVALSVAAAVAAVWLSRRLRDRGGFVACAVAVGAYVVVLATAAALLPGAPVADFPGQLLWEFRVASLLGLVALWATIAVVLTGLVDRAWRRAQADTERRELAASL